MSPPQRRKYSAKIISSKASGGAFKVSETLMESQSGSRPASKMTEPQRARLKMWIQFNILSLRYRGTGRKTKEKTDQLTIDHLSDIPCQNPHKQK